MSGDEDGGDEELRRELARLAAIRSDVVPGAFVSPHGAKRKSAGEVRLADDQRSGRLLWRAAGQRARLGLDALDRGDRHMAEDFLQQAQAAERDALRLRLGAAGLADLSTGARPRGRKAGSGSPTIAARNRWLAEAVAAQITRGIAEDAAAILAALADPAADPEMKAAFRDMTPDGLARALKAGRKSADKKSKTDF